MSLVTLTSGGLDSTLLALTVKREGITQFPLFVDYGQINMRKEFNACIKNFRAHDLPPPTTAKMAGFGALIPSGITNRSLRVREDAFLPGRNLLFLLTGASYAYAKGASGVAIGLLDEGQALFPDQTSLFLSAAEKLLSACTGRSISIVAPFIKLSKAQVYEEARSLGISNTYSCHAGSTPPCGVCIACNEYSFLGAEYGRRRGRRK
jgi:7-cyano-7-deazaguanine synthase